MVHFLLLALLRMLRCKWWRKRVENVLKKNAARSRMQKKKGWDMSVPRTWSLMCANASGTQALTLHGDPGPS